MTKLYEEVNPTQYVDRGIMNVDDAAVRDNINTLLTGSLMACTLTPYIALEKVRKVLSYFHIHLPAVPFMEGDRGVHVFDVHQFGNLAGMRNDGEVVTKVSQPYSIYFEYQQNDKGMFDVFCEIVTQDELEDLLDDAEEDINDDGAEDDREDRLDEAYKSDKLDRKATRQAVIGKALKLIGAKKTGNRMTMKAHLTSKKADDAYEKEDRMDESVIDKTKRILRKASGKQQKEISSKIDQAMDKRQIELLGRKYTDSPVPITDRKKLQDDERYNSLNRRYITTNYPEFRKRYLGDKKKTVKESSESVSLAGSETGTKRIAGAPGRDMCDSAKMAAMKILKELRLYNPDGSSTINLPGPLPPGTDVNSFIRKLPNIYDKKDQPDTPRFAYGRDAGRPDTGNAIGSSQFTKPGGDGPPAGTDPFKGVTPRIPGTSAPALKPGEMNIHADNPSKPYNPSPDRFSSIKEPEPMKPHEMKGGYEQKITETSHETVNHVRRLAMKNKRNDR